MLRLTLISILLLVAACGKSTVNPNSRNCITQTIGNDVYVDCSDGTSTRIANAASCPNLIIKSLTTVVE